jgi:hypothetical protein
MRQVTRLAESLQEFPCPVFRIGCAAAVTANQYFVPGQKRVADHLEGALQVAPARIKERESTNQVIEMA